MSCDESVRAVLAPTDARDDQVPRRKRRRRCKVVFARVRELRIPQQFAGETVERNDVRIVGFHEDTVARHGNATVRTAAYRHCPCAPPFVMPDLPATSGIEREALIGASDVHHSADDDRCDLEGACTGKREHPRHR